MDQLEALKKTSEQSGGDLSTWMDSLHIAEKVARWLPMEEEQLNDSLKAGMGAVAGGIAKLLQAVLSQIPYVLVSGLVVLLAVYFLLIDGERSVQLMRERSPFPRRQTSLVLRSVRASCNSAILASLVTGLIQAILMVLASIIFGVPNVVLIGLGTFISSLVPLLGTAPISLGIALMFFIQGAEGKAIGIILVGVFIGIVDNFVRPLLVRSGTRIHPLSAFVFTFGAVSTIGFYGLFIGPVAAGILSAMIRSWRENGA
ncbi:MAG: AI-2E family transporter [Bdellovibrionota bacterium]